MSPAPKKLTEPTLRDLFTVLSTLSTRAEGIYKAVHSIHDRVNLIDSRLITIERSVGKLTAKIEDFQDDLTFALARLATRSASSD